MYKIHTFQNHLLVKFEEDFDCNAIKAIIHHETRMPEYERMNDIWLIEKHHALVSLGDLETLVQDFRCRCPRNAIRRKTALVAELGLTEAILQLWVKEAKNRVPFDMQIFHTLEEAEVWLGVAEPTVA